MVRRTVGKECRDDLGSGDLAFWCGRKVGEGS